MVTMPVSIIIIAISTIISAVVLIITIVRILVITSEIDTITVESIGTYYWKSQIQCVTLSSNLAGFEIDIISNHFFKSRVKMRGWQIPIVFW